VTDDGRPFTVAGRLTVVTNGLLALAVTGVPAVVDWYYAHETDPRLLLWIVLAALLHVAGFLGAYSVQTGLLSWYDQVAHMVSAALIAGVGYAILVALDRRSRRNRFPGSFRFVFTVALVMAVGVSWEILEFGAGTVAGLLGADEVLVQYGTDDIVFDLTFNTLAGVLVAVWGTGYFTGLTSLFRRHWPGSGNS